MARLTKKQKELQRDRARWEFDLQFIKFIDGFVSKEEPTITLSLGEKMSLVTHAIAKNISKLKNG